MARRRYAFAGALVVAVGLVATASFGALSPSGKPAATGVGSDGVQVHGQWAVVVRSIDGMVVGQYEFHNDFVGAELGTSGGADALAQILSGSKAPGAWDLSIQGSGCPASNGHFCQMFEPASSPSFFATPPDTKNLTVTAAESGTDAFKIVLQGSVTATDDGTIDRVGTGLQRCPPTAAVGADCGIGYNEITDRTLGTPINVLAGQSISITVKLSFS